MSARLWTADEIAAAMGATSAGPRPGAVSGVSIDTRTIAAGDLFFAIRGEARDGHDFVREALAKGAAAAVVSRERAAEFEDAGPVFVVPDVLDGMRALGAAARRRTGARIAAITGSVGKTGTKEALRLALSRQGATHASAHSYNNHWGVPLTLARMPRESAYGVYELGMNHTGEIAPLAAMVRPHVALVTTVEAVHIEYFRSIWGIVDAKSEIFSGLEPGGTAILNRDSPHFDRMRIHAAASPAGRILSFGEHEAADIRAERIIVRPDTSIVEARVLGAPVVYRVGMPGRHIALNSLGVLAAVHALGADVAAASSALGSLAPPAGRGERTALPLPGGELVVVDESYNANPASMRAALDTLGRLEVGAQCRRIAVLGDMLELGADGPARHRELAEPIERNGIDLVFAAGPLMRHLVAALPPGRRGGYAETSADLEAQVVKAVRPGDTVMVKGSNGIRMARIVQALKSRFGAAAGAAAS